MCLWTYTLGGELPCGHSVQGDVEGEMSLPPSVCSRRQRPGELPSAWDLTLS